MDYFKFQIETTPATAEILLALLSELPFDTFEETEGGLNAFIPAHELTELVEEGVGELAGRFNFSFKKEFIPGQNWNEIWESNFHPVVVGNFCGIRASFHEPLQGVQHELVINPKMAFGTGHHETTHMVIEAMQTLDFKEKSVLDYGCGTGVLAILAARLGATRLDAIDIEEESYLNTVENAATNLTPGVRAMQGTLELVSGNLYDIILANINRNVILDSLPSLSRMLKPGGTLVVSGFVAEDEALMKTALASHHFQLIGTKRRNNWLAMVVMNG